MLKFVQGPGHGEPAERVTVSANATTTQRKDGEHSCTVCRTRRRSLERQTANVLRRSRSRETLVRSANNANKKCIASVTHESIGPQVEEGAGKEWREPAAKWGKYRRLSRSCEALTTSNKATRLNITNENIDRSKRVSHQCKLILLRDGRTIDQDVIGEHQNSNKCTSRQVPTLRDTSVKRGDVGHVKDDDGGRKSTPLGSRTEEVGGPRSSRKQVQFGGVEYETSNESVMRNLKTAVGVGGRRMRSRSLERIERRVVWDEERTDKKTQSERMDRLSSTSCMVDGDRSHWAKPSRDGTSVSDLGQQRDRRRSRSRSRDRSDGMIRVELRTRIESDNQPHCCERNRVISQECLFSRNENVTLAGRPTADNALPPSENWSAESKRMDEPRGIMPSSGVRSPLDAHQNGNEHPIHNKNYLKQSNQDSNALISPHYVAPNGHYGTAVIRKCHENQRQIDNSKQIPKRSPKDSLPTTDATSRNHKTANLAHKENVHRNPLEKCGISAQKIAKLDCPLEVRVSRSSMSCIVDPRGINVSSEDEATISGRLTDQIGLDETSDSRAKSPQNCVSDTTCQPAGYVYNCATAKITKLDTGSSEDTSPKDPDSHLSELAGDLRKIEPTNNLVRHASVASLSLISVNSVDSGTSCHDGSTTDSSSASSDKDMEIHSKRHAALGCQTASRQGGMKQRLGREARQYTASAKELEQLILSSCFGKDKHGTAQVTSDYESDTGPVDVDRRRKNSVARVVRFVGSKNENSSDTHNIQHSKPKGQSSRSINGHHNLARMTTPARVQHTHKAMAKAEMSVQCGDLVHLAPEDFEQRPLWVMAYSNKSGQFGLIPSVYLET